MAAKTPTAYSTAGDPNVLLPDYRTTPVAIPVAGSSLGKAGLRHQVFYFAAIDVGPDTWASGIQNIVSLAWSSEEDGIGTYVRLNDAPSGTVYFVGGGANTSGWLHVWSRG